MRLKLVSGLVAVFVSGICGNVFAHGEDQPGPHGGFIRMPGAFHTEVVPEKGGFKVYLLDLEFKNPVVKKSSIKVGWKSAGRASETSCVARADHFFCSFDEKAPGRIEIQATRDDAKASMTADYDWPLKRVTEKKSGSHH